MSGWKCPIWSVSKLGSALHALTSSDAPESAVTIALYRVPVFAEVTKGNMMVSSTRLGHAATYPKAGGSQSPSSPRGPDHLRDGSSHETRGITKRLTFEFRIDARALMNFLEGTDPSPYPRVMSSTLLQCLRIGYAAIGRVRALIWGSLTRFNAFLSGVVMPPPSPISNV